jgi:hypothetical protein
MRSWNSLPPSLLKPSGDATKMFLELGVNDYRAAARFVNRLPYGRNSSRVDTLAVLREGHGTCSTKHALLKQLASEQDLAIALMIGIYEMTERNTPGIGQVLAKYKLACVPEAHCYLRYGGNRIDVTRAFEGAPAEPISRFLHEEEIEPVQVGDYKVDLHQRFVRNWLMKNAGISGGCAFEEIWRIREECIAALSI